MQEIRKLLVFVKPYWRRAAVALFLLTSLVFLDLAIPRLVQRIIDQGINRNNLSVVLQTSALMLGVTVVSTLFAIGNNILSIQVGEGTARDLREAIFLKIQSFSYGNLDHFTTGNLMVRLTSDAAAVQRLVQVSLRIGTRAPLLMIGSLILMINTDRRLALTMLPLLVITSILVTLFSFKMEPFFRDLQQKLDRLNTVLQENIAGARLVKSFVRADYEGQRFEDANEDFTRRNIAVMQFMSVLSPALTVFVNIGVVIVVWSGGMQAIRGDLTVGQIVAFTNYLMTTMGPLVMMTLLSNVWANGIASGTRINAVLETEPEVPVVPDARPLAQPLRGQIEFEHVSFHYNHSDDHYVLEEINLKILPGQTAALLGATGAGKTTLVNLIPRFYDPSAGRVLLDGLDVRAIEPESLLGQIGIVPQETILFSGTIAENIRYGNPNASEEQMVAAAKAAQAHAFITAMPAGYNTRVEERGANLSGGQKQRIAIARALLTHPRILILDDSTSSVDVETETRIQEALDRLLQGTTRVIVAQRISTVLKADKIVVIDKGRVAAEGTHAELLLSSPIYQEIYESQLGSGFRVQTRPAVEED